MINTKDERNILQVGPGEEEDVDIQGYMDHMIEMIIKELVTSASRQHIDYREFRNLMWNTDIDKTCVIYLEEE